MPKMKSRKSVVSRFRVTATGKLKRRRPGLRHILTKKSPKRKRSLARPALVDEVLARTYRKVMSPYKA